MIHERHRRTDGQTLRQTALRGKIWYSVIEFRIEGIVVVYRISEAGKKWHRASIA